MNPKLLELFCEKSSGKLVRDSALYASVAGQTVTAASGPPQHKP